MVNQWEDLVNIDRNLTAGESTQHLNSMLRLTQTTFSKQLLHAQNF